jgi:hypothetical protein
MSGAVQAVQCSPNGPSEYEPQSGGLDSLARRGYAAAAEGMLRCPYSLEIVRAA